MFLWRKEMHKAPYKMGIQLTLCMLDNFACFFVVCGFCFFIDFFKNIFQEYYQSVKRFGSRSGLTFFGAWSWFKLFAKVISRRQKYTYDLVAIPASEYLTRSSAHNHPLAYWKIFTRTDYYKYTFFPRTIIHWNALSVIIVTLPTLAQFSSAVSLVVHVSP